MRRSPLPSVTALSAAVVLLAGARSRAQSAMPLRGGDTARDLAAIADTAPGQDRFLRTVPEALLFAYLPPPRAQDAAGPALVVCPGGGYAGLAIDKEGHEIARWFQARGVAAFVLAYRLPDGKAPHDVPLSDAQRALRTVRTRAQQWRVDPARVGILGFSAGGHLAATASTAPGDGDAQARDPIERASARPDFCVLCYPVVSMRDPLAHAGSRRNLLGAAPGDELLARWSAEARANAGTPPTFLVHAQDDPIAVGNSLAYHAALVAHGVPAALHVFARGGHGFALRRTGHAIDAWPELCLRWLVEIGVLATTDQDRRSVPPGAALAATLGATRGSVVATPVLAGERPRFLMPALDDETRATLRAQAPGVEIVEAGDAAAALALAPRVHGADARFCTDEFLRAATALRWVQAFSAGVERWVDIPELAGNDSIVLTNMRGIFSDPIADHALGMLLHLTRGLRHDLASQQEQRWARGDGTPRDELAGKTIVVFGLGGIGTAVARRAAAFGMHVVGVDVAVDRTPPDFVRRIVTPEHLDAELAHADAVAICAPLTDSTRGLFDGDRLARVKPGAILLNVARGPIVVTEALVANLASGRLGGAGLDVTDPEPLPEGHALWSLPNVIVTPHVSGRSPGTEARRDALFAENLRRFGAGEPLLNVVDKAAGY